MTAPIMVDRRWPAWKGLAILGEEKSISMCLPSPTDLDVPNASVKEDGLA